MFSSLVNMQPGTEALPKRPYKLGDIGVSVGTIGCRRPILSQVTLSVWPIYWVTGQLIAGRPINPEV